MIGIYAVGTVFSLSLSLSLSLLCSARLSLAFFLQSVLTRVRVGLVLLFSPHAVYCSSDVYYNLGLCCLKLGDQKLALKLFNQAVSLDNSHPLALFEVFLYPFFILPRYLSFSLYRLPISFIQTELGRHRNTHTFAHTQTHTFAHTHTHTQTHTLAHTDTHRHTHTDTHRHTH